MLDKYIFFLPLGSVLLIVFLVLDCFYLTSNYFINLGLTMTFFLCSYSMTMILCSFALILASRNLLGDSNLGEDTSKLFSLMLTFFWLIVRLEFDFDNFDYSFNSLSFFGSLYNIELYKLFNDYLFIYFSLLTFELLDSLLV